MCTAAGGGREITSLQLGLLFAWRSMVLARRAGGARSLGVVGRTVLVDWRLETTEMVSKRLGIRVAWGRGSIVAWVIWNCYCIDGSPLKGKILLD